MVHHPTLSRRSALALGLAAALPLPAFALGSSEAERFMAGVVDDMRSLLTAGATPEQSAARFLQLLEAKAAVDQVAKFAMGRTWREMSGAQQAAYLKAFRGYISRTYARRFKDYSGEDIRIDGSVDAGRKGVLVKSSLLRPGADSVALEWLVTDRLGPPKIADIVFEGISLSITLREVFGGMVETRNGNVDQFIADLDSAAGA